MEDINNKKNSNQNVSVQSGPKEAPRPVSEFIKPSESLPNIEQELADYVKSSEQELTEEQRAIGISDSPASTPVQTEPTSRVHIMSDEEAQKIIKETHNFNADIGEYDDHRGYTAPSRDFRAALVHKVYQQMRKVVGLFRPKQTQTE